MKFYLSSLKLGNQTDELRQWIKEHDNKICLIPNAKDVYPDGERKTAKIYADVQELINLGFEVTILSLKEYFDKKEELLKKLEEFHAFYVIGGNAFALRQAICILAKDMHGLEMCDDPNINPYGIETIWEGLGYFDYLFLPHYKSDHKETKLIDDCVAYCGKHNISYKTLHDGDVIIAEFNKGIEKAIEKI